MSRFIYSLGNRFYVLAIHIASLWNKKAKQWVNGRKNWKKEMENFQQKKVGKTVWMHCSSLGEFEQGRPVFEQLKQQFPQYQYCISFFSPSGYEVQKNYPNADLVFYLPVNNKANAEWLIKSLQPALVLWIKYDFWSKFLFSLSSQSIPVLLLSAKFFKQQSFFKFYGSYWIKMLTVFKHIFVQDKSSANLLDTIGIQQYTIAGDTRFDRVTEIAQQNKTFPNLVEFCGQHQVFIAGSTWLEDEEEICHFANHHKNMRFIIAPHDIQETRLKEVEKLFTNTCRYSKWQSGDKANVLILDNMGFLAYFYRYATICYIGGGFTADGVHNVLEAAVYGKPVIFGPEYEKYREAIDLIELEAAFSIEDALELEEICNELLEDENFYAQTVLKAENYVRSNCGSSGIIQNYITANRLLTRL